MNLTGSVALVTGANRGLGARLVTELLHAGAAKVYAASRTPAAAAATGGDPRVQPLMAGYSASKAAAHSITQALRAELRDRGITVLGAYPGGIDTDMLAGIEAPKAPPEAVAERIIAALAAGQAIVFPDDASASAGAVYLSDPVQLEHLLAG